jgi:uncharacterized membrane protein YjfL (UPF0719 family)
MDFLLGLGIAFGQLFIGLILSLVSIYIGLRAFDWLTLGIDKMKEIKKGNVAVGILMASVVFAIAIVVQSGVAGLTYAFVGKTAAQIPAAIIIGLIQLAICLFGAIVSNHLSIRILDVITAEIDELSELKKGNVAVAVMMGGVLVSVALVVSAAISGIPFALGALI